MKKQNIETEPRGNIKTFVDMIAPSIIKFNVDHFICGNTFRCVWGLREYPTSTIEQVILRHLGERKIGARHRSYPVIIIEKP